MQDQQNLQEIQKEWHGSLKSYVIGLIVSLVLTGASFLLVGMRLLTGPSLIFSIAGLGLVQGVLQLLLFLHVGQETKPRWETLVFLFMVLVLVIIVVGTLWIMYDLNNRVMPGMPEIISIGNTHD